MMPFGLKNAGATYQRLMNKVLTELIRKTMEVYVDDMITKSVKEIDHVKETLLNEINPKKCPFGVRFEIFLVYMTDQIGMGANPDKIKAVLNIKSATTVKEVQELTGCIACLLYTSPSPRDGLLSRMPSSA